MKLTIENTSKIVKLNGVPARVWEGITESGIPVICYITRIVVSNVEGVDYSEFQRELSEERAPSAEVQAFPPRLIL